MGISTKSLLCHSFGYALVVICLICSISRRMPRHDFLRTYLFRRNEISLHARNARFRHQKGRLEGALIDGFLSDSNDFSGLCHRLLESFSKLWVFSEFTDVDPTNNLAERDLRRVVLWRKRCYGTRSERGQRFVERISSVVSTVKKAGGNVLRYIQQTVVAFFMNKPAPIIDPILGF